MGVVNVGVVSTNIDINTAIITILIIINILKCPKKSI